MALSVKHSLVSAVADSGNAALVQPSNWNAEHALLATDGKLLGASGSTTVGEVTVGSGLALTTGTLTVTPAGADKQIQINSSGALGASANLTFDSAAGALTFSDGTDSLKITSVLESSGTNLYALGLKAPDGMDAEPTLFLKVTINGTQLGLIPIWFYNP